MHFSKVVILDAIMFRFLDMYINQQFERKIQRQVLTRQIRKLYWFRRTNYTYELLDVLRTSCILLKINKMLVSDLKLNELIFP